METLGKSNRAARNTASPRRSSALRLRGRWHCRSRDQCQTRAPKNIAPQAKLRLASRLILLTMNCSTRSQSRLRQLRDVPFSVLPVLHDESARSLVSSFILVEPDEVCREHQLAVPVSPVIRRIVEIMFPAHFRTHHDRAANPVVP